MKKVAITLLLLFLFFPTLTIADPGNYPLTGQYNINAQTINLGLDSWQFIYTITNLTEGVGDWTGLDGFFVAVPLTATISNIQVPDPYKSGTGAYWISYDGTFPPIDTSTYKWLKFWGAGPDSVYPIGTSAVFKFDANNVHIGTNEGYVITYFYDDAQTYTDPNWWYHAYYSQITGPIPNSVPEPTTILLLSLGLIGLVGVRTKTKL